MRIGSLCSGVGGLDLGLIAAVGGEVAWHVEYDKHPSAVLEARFPGVPNYGDITTTDWSEVEPVDWITAGYPCQPFSHAGKRKGSADERHLWPFVADAIGSLRPRRVLLENVAGHVTLGLDAVLWDLAALGYDAVWGVVRAADAGAPHGRARIFIVAADTRRERHGGRKDGRSLGRVDREDASEARQRERSRSEPGDRSAAAVADADVWGCEGGKERDCDPPQPAADRDSRWRDADGCGDPTAHAESDGRHEGRAESARLVGGLDAAECGGPASANTDSERRQRRWHPRHGIAGPADNDVQSALDWGAYEPAIRRWERVTRRPAPRPTEPGRSGERLSPRFVEWMMGLPDGWVTDVGLPRNAQLKALGNGVVPQQAALASRTLLDLQAVAA